MGKILVVRVSASTYDDADVKKRYPLLYQFAWPVNDDYIPAAQRFGIMELITTLDEAIDFADWPQNVKTVLAPFIEEISHLQKTMQELILAWQPKEADAISYQIEEKLDELEAYIKKEKISVPTAEK